MIEKNAKIFVAGHNGLAGSAMVRCLKKNGYCNLILKSHDELDLTNQTSVNDFFNEEKPEIVLLFAAKVGGVYANSTYPVDFISTNISIQSNVISAALSSGVKTLLFIASGAIYPKNAQHPLKESSLLTGVLEPANEPYAIAKIAGLKTCEYIQKQYGLNYFTLIPCNLYGPGDKYEGLNTHVVPATVKKIHDAKMNNENVTIWGSGKPVREFMYVDDLADACLFFMNRENNPPFVNVGSGCFITIQEMTQIVADVIGFKGEILNDLTKPEGASIITLDSTLANSLGWKSHTSFEDGIRKTYDCYVKRDE